MRHILLATCLLTSSAAFAQETSLIAGFNYAKSMSAEAKVEIKVGNSNSEIVEDIDNTVLGFYLGHINKNNNRFLLSYSKASIDFDISEGSEDISGLDLDWQFVYGKDQVQPYWGIGFGFHSIDKAIVLTDSPLEGDSLKGVSFQMMAGLKVAINQQIELDISFQRKAYAWNSIEISSGFSTATIEPSYTHNAINIGAGFKF